MGPCRHAVPVVMCLFLRYSGLPTDHHFAPGSHRTRLSRFVFLLARGSQSVCVVRLYVVRFESAGLAGVLPVAVGAGTCAAADGLPGRRRSSGRGIVKVSGLSGLYLGVGRSPPVFVRVMSDAFRNFWTFWLGNFAASALCTVASLCVSGFDYGVLNNVFHIPYVLDLAHTPAFSGNAFYQTLDKFTSIVWPVAKLLANEENIYAVFFALFVVSRFAAYSGLYYLFSVNGIDRFVWRLFGLLFLSAVGWFYGWTSLGFHGLFLQYFTQSEVTWGPIFFGLAFLQQRRVLLAALMIGLTFSINAFVGIWFGFLAVGSTLFYRQAVTVSNIVKVSLVFLLAASPVVYWIGTSIGDREPVDFSFREYIRHYFSNHFLIEAARLNSIVVTGLMFAAGVLAAFYSKSRAYWLGLQVSWLVLFGIGIVLPYAFDNRFVFNLHLLRSDGVEQAIAVILSVWAAIHLWQQERGKYDRILSMILLASLTTGEEGAWRYVHFSLALAALANGLLYRAEAFPNALAGILKPIRKLADPLALALLLLFVVVNIVSLVHAGADIMAILRFVVVLIVLAVCFAPGVRLPPAQSASLCLGMLFAVAVLSVATLTSNRLRLTVEEQAVARMHDDWVGVMQKIRDSDLEGDFLVPLDEMESGFQAFARRPAWVDWKQGAAVMWAPSFYSQWSTRYDEVSALHTDADLAGYAEAHQIPNIIVLLDKNGCADPYREAFRSTYYAVCVR